MEERDYLLRQMNSLGRALGKLLSDLLKNNNDINLDVIKTTNETLIDELSIDITSLFLMKDEEIIELFVDKNKLDNENLNNIVDILILNIESKVKNNFTNLEKINLHKKCLLILNFIDIKTKTFSIERNNKCQTIKQQINDLN